MDRSDFFESLFGRQTGGAQQRDRHARGKDQHAKVLIDLEDAYLGAQRSISLRMPVMDAAGQTLMQERKLDVRIPRGMHAGQHLRLLGQGEAGRGDGIAGDLYLEIGFHPHAQYRIDVRDVFMDLPLTPWEAVLGCSLAIPTPEGMVSVNIPAGSAAGRQLRLKGRGIPGTPPGDLYAVLSIILPPAVSETEKQAYRTLAGAFNFNPRQQIKGNSL
jgi:curved DNA-binding protein